MGYGWAYRVLDAQWVRTHGHSRAVPQRRRRVFLVGCLGDATGAAKVLFEQESVGRDFAPSRAARKVASAAIEGSVGTSSKQAMMLSVFDKQRIGEYSNGAVSSTVARRDYKDATDLVVGVPFSKKKRAQSETDDETWSRGEVAPTQSPFDSGEIRATTVVVEPIVIPIQDGREIENKHQNGFGVGEDGDVAYTMTAIDRAAVGVDLFNNCTTGDIHVPLRTAGGHGAPAVLTQQVYGGSSQFVSDTVTSKWHKQSGGPAGSECGLFVAETRGMVVRRLTPLECERLMGFPDGYTDVPYRGKPAPDGQRYKALGNSMAVNCMEWVGSRIQAVEDQQRKPR